MKSDTDKIIRNIYSYADDDLGHQSSLFYLLLAILQKQSESGDSLANLTERFADLEESVFEMENDLKDLKGRMEKQQSETIDIMSDDVMF